MTTKILDRQILAVTVAALRRKGRTLVSTNGSFDLLHAGHVAMLEEAKALGDVLIVGLNSDLSVRRYKGRSRPICPQDQRAAMLAALACTDYVTLFDELTPIPLLEIIQPNIHVNSPEHGYECVERAVVERHGGRIHLARLVEGLSTSQLLARISTALRQEARRGIFLTPAGWPGESADDILTFCQTLHDAAFALFLLTDAEQPTAAPLVDACRQRSIPLHALTRPLHDLDQIDGLVADYDLALARSFLISRSMADIQIGRDVNCKTIWLATGADRNPAPQTHGAPGPHFTAQSLQEILTII